MLVICEGLDGSFKTTFCEKLTAKLLEAGVSAEMGRQPGGTEYAEEIRKLIKSECISTKERLTIYSESMLFLAARSQIYEMKILPAIAEGKVFVSDRCNLSTIAYQSFKGVNEDYLTKLIRMAPWFTLADIMFVIQIPSTLAEKRIKSRGEPSDYLEKRLSHCEQVYRNFDHSKLSKKTIIINGLDEDGNEVTSDEMAETAFKQLMETQGINK